MSDKPGLAEALAVGRPARPSPLALLGGVALFCLGLLMIVLAVFVEDRETVAAALVALGAVLAVLGVLAPRLEGPLEVGATGGLKAQLSPQELVVTAVENGFGPEEVGRLLDMYERAAEDAAKNRALAVLLAKEDSAPLEGDAEDAKSSSTSEPP